MAAECGLRIFHRHGPRQLLAERLGYTEAILSSPTEPNGIRGVNRHRHCLAAVFHPLFSLGNQAPHLAAGKGPPAVQRSLRPHLPLSERITVALVIIRSDARRQEVR